MNLFERERVELMLNYAKSFIGTPYVWGANGGGAFDCSGYVQEVLSCIGLDPKGDQTAQKLYDFFIKKSRGSGIQKGSLLFWGKNVKSISHVSIALDFYHHIESGGGNSRTKTVADALTQNAMVRIRPISKRSDLISAIKI
tara:strand:+ start:289 stop:711 length:423 start_codon:yes stop_codon:yes gene_type:complete